MQNGSHDSTALFEEKAVWAAHQDNPYLEERNRIVREMIPRGVRSILDVGCGTGLLIRALKNDYLAIGLDPSRLALASLETSGVCGRAEALPFRICSVDLLSCLEVLEHLDARSLDSSTKELARVSRRWILLATPDSEDPRRNALRCPRCGEIFNRSHHQRSLGESRLAGLFPGFVVRAVRRGGQGVRGYPYPLLWIRHRIARRFYKGPGETRGLCPRCGNRDFPRFRHNLLSFVLDGVNRIVSRRRPYWIFLLLERSPDPGAAGR